MGPRFGIAKFVELTRLTRVYGTVRPPATIAKLVQITPMSLWFMVLIIIVIGAFVNQLITRGPHIVDVRQLVICPSNK